MSRSIAVAEFHDNNAYYSDYYKESQKKNNQKKPLQNCRDDYCHNDYVCNDVEQGRALVSLLDVPDGVSSF